jgi:hypothetical protein
MNETSATTTGSSREAGGANVWTITGFACLGGSVGALSGLSSAAVTLPLIAALLALIGGGFVPFLSKTPKEDRELIGKLMCVFCVVFILMLVLGIVLKVNGWLVYDGLRASELRVGSTATDQRKGAVDLLKADRIGYADKIEALCRSEDFAAMRSALLDATK